MTKSEPKITAAKLAELFKSVKNDELYNEMKTADFDELLKFELSSYGFRTEGNRADAARDVVNNIILQRLKESIDRAGKNVQYVNWSLAAIAIIVAIVLSLL